MAGKKSLSALIDHQFGPRAAAYVASAVHSSGPDLAWIAERAERAQPCTALDLGAGGGHVSYAMAAHAGRVIACDLSDQMLAAVAETARAKDLDNLETKACDVCALPLDDGSIDFAASRFSAHHWQDLDAALRECRRVMPAGATAVFADAVSPGTPLLDTHLQAIELLRDPSHVRDYAIEEWVAALQGASFAIQELKRFRLRIDFKPWIERMQTPPDHERALRSLQMQAPREVAAHFEIGEDGSYTLDCAGFEVRAI
ncbi:class I SAM-dependent methyltransferase [Pelagibius sp.]|uniref:class I SAM-dependent methyltransferase n=1 Tax=Pelagibius sp. TaxID=1931238 RepID=UPI002609F904|nr:class I SAM-dependent methyltransferase [Pelagibius sp.]